MRPSPTAYLGAAVAALALVVTGYVVLVVTGNETGGLLAFVSPILGALLLAAQVHVTSKDQETRHAETVQKIETAQAKVEQISDELDQHLRQLVREAISQAMSGREVLPMRRSSDQLGGPRPSLPTMQGERGAP